MSRKRSLSDLSEVACKIRATEVDESPQRAPAPRHPVAAEIEETLGRDHHVIGLGEVQLKPLQVGFHDIL